MLNVPRHDWSFFESQSKAADVAWLQGLSTRERSELSASLFNTIWNARQNLSGDWERLDAQRWQDKLELRRLAVDAFQKLDQLRSERSTANNAG